MRKYRKISRLSKQKHNVVSIKPDKSAIKMRNTTDNVIIEQGQP